MPKIPPNNRDLKSYVLRKDMFRLFRYLLWLGIWIGGAISYNYNHQTYPIHRRIVGWRMALWVSIAAISGFLILRVWKLFTDRTCVGKIKHSGLSRSYSASDDPGAANKIDYDFRLNTKLKIETKNEKVKSLRFEQKRGFYQYYNEGKDIVKFHGLPYPIDLTPNAPNGFVCAACGMWYENMPTRCEKCNHTLIDPKDIEI